MAKKREWKTTKAEDAWQVLRIQGEFTKGFDQLSELGPCISIFGSARTEPLNPYYKNASKLAYLCTQNGYGVISGGGPGIMEAANKGSHLANSPSIGLNISLPFEQQANPYVSPQLDFDFHYFFMRKLWFADLAEAILVFPGGFGTCDELMEILTLVQTRKIQKKIPILVYGREYWNEVINFSAFVKWGMISESDLDLFHFLDTPDEAVGYIQQNIRMVCPVETDQNLDGHI